TAVLVVGMATGVVSGRVVAWITFRWFSFLRPAHGLLTLLLVAIAVWSLTFSFLVLEALHLSLLGGVTVTVALLAFTSAGRLWLRKAPRRSVAAAPWILVGLLWLPAP